MSVFSNIYDYLVAAAVLLAFQWVNDWFFKFILLIKYTLSKPVLRPQLLSLVSNSQQLSECADPSSLLQEYALLCWRGKYQTARWRSFGEVNPQEVWDQSCTSVVIWLVFSLPFLFASEHRWRFICCLFPLDSFSFSVPIFSPAPSPPLLSQEPACQQKPCTSPCAYQTVYPFPVGAVLHLWLWQPIATPRVHSKPWFRRSALPALLYQPPPPQSLMWIFHTQGTLSLQSSIAWLAQSLPNARKQTISSPSCVSIPVDR